jgi:hypothetical protein
MKDGRHDGVLQLLTPQKLPSAMVPGKRIKAALASFDFISATFFSIKRQYVKPARRILRPDRYPCGSGVT